MKNGKSGIVFLALLCTAACIGSAGGKEALAQQNAEAAAEERADLPEGQAVGSGMRKLIIDTDTGADDACALILAAEAEDIEILGVTVLVGNVDLEQSCRNALMALEVAGCDAPVYRGTADTYSGKTIEAFSVFGTDGMGDADLIHPEREAEEKDAVDFILDTVKEYPGEVEIAALGPATNIANAIERDPETMQQVKMIWSMGSAGLGPGNATPVAEFNVYSDAAAYKVMLDSGLPVTIVGLDMCGGSAMWTGEQFGELEKMNDVGAFITDSFGKIRDFYAGNGYDDSVMNCDPLAMMCVLYPDFINSSIQTHASCIADSGETYGQVIFYKEGFNYDVAENDYNYNVTLIDDVKKEEYFDRFKKAIQK